MNAAGPQTDTSAALLDVRRLRGLVLALRHDVSQYEPPATPDEDLVAVATGRFTDVDDAAARLGRLEALLAARGDRRAVFLTVYTRMTERIRARIDRGGFADPGWMRAYTTTFADHYRRAFLAFERGALDAVPDPWRVAFGTALRGDALVLQDAFLGINAHINYDLALTLHEVGIDPDRAARLADHRAVDEVLARLVDAQQATLAELYADGIADIDAALGSFDERLSLLGLTAGREQAWRVAAVLTDTDWPPVAALARWYLRTTATGGAAFVRHRALDGGVAERLARVERDGLGVEMMVETLGRRLDAVQ